MAHFKVVVTDHVFESLEIEREELTRIDAVLVQSPGMTEGDIIETARDADAVLTSYARITGRVIASLEKCRVIARYGIGVDNVDIAAATRKGIMVTNVPDYCIEEVADHALALLLTCARKVAALDRTVRLGKWSFAESRPIYRLRGKTLGLVGFGKIARAMAERARALGLRLVVYDPHITGEVVSHYSARLVPLADLLQESDYVSIHTPLTAETRGLIGESELRLMKKEAYLINTSRGGVIDEEALYTALKEKWIAGAALDVLSDEKSAHHNPLLRLDNVILTPHVGFYSEESMEELRRKAVGEVVSVLSGRVPRYLINKQGVMLAGDLQE